MTIQSTADIGQIIRNAVVFNVRNWTGSAMNSDSLLTAVQNLFTLLEQRKIDYVLVGGIALLYYVEGRNTQDLDLLMAVSSLEKLPELEITSQDKDFAHARFGDLEIDILLTRNLLFKRVQKKHAHIQAFLDRSVSLASVEGLLLLKLYALPSLYRQGNFARVGIYENDVATLLQAFHPDVSTLLGELGDFVDGGDLAEIQNILAEIQARIRRFNR